MPITPTPMDGDNSNVFIESGGNSFYVATDAVIFDGLTAQFQLFKLAFGPTGSATIVSSADPFPVNVLGGGITANLVGFCGAVQGIVGGTPVTVSGTVNATGVTSAPVFVRTYTGYQVEVTGGRNLNKTTDNISVYGPSGSTWVYASLVNSSGTEIGNITNPVHVQISGATITAIINPSVGVTNGTNGPLIIQGTCTGYPISTTVGNTIGIVDTNIISGLCGIYNQLSTLNIGLGTAVPTGFTTGRATSTFPSVQQLATGFTCTKGVSVKALSTNTDFVYLGSNGSISSSIGHALDPGDSVFLSINNINKVYLLSASSTQAVTYIAS